MTQTTQLASPDLAVVVPEIEVDESGGDSVIAESEAGVEAAGTRLSRADRAGLAVAGGILATLAVVIFAMLAQLGPLGAVRHHRDQAVGYASLREQLANATAPVAQVDADGRLYPLGTPVALLTIPALGLDEVILEGTSSEVLASGPGHRRDTVLPGQVGTSVILGRRAAYGGPFARIGELAPGTSFTVTTGQGEHTYRVLGLRRAGDPQPTPLAAGQGRLTLVTATGSAYAPNGVLRVDGLLVSPAQDTPTAVIAPGTLPDAETPMRGDRGAWLLIVLWAEALLVAAVVFVWARYRWGRWQAWVAGVPVLAFVGVSLAAQVTRLLPNLM